MNQGQPVEHSSEVVILLISSSCCFPQVASIDLQAEKVIRQALTETGIKGQIQKITASSVLMGGIPLEILENSGLTVDISTMKRLPATLIHNRLVSYGIPRVEEIKNALLANEVQR